MPTKIRLARETDSESIVALVSDYAREKGNTINTDEVVGALRSCINSPERSVLVAQGDRRIEGYLVAHWVPFPMIGGTECYISDLMVSATQRGLGTGRQLVAALEDRAREKGCTRLMLNNRTASESFKRQFYPKLGFRVRDDFANMVKTLR